MEKIKGIIKSKSFHIIWIVLGSILILLTAFFIELWYDESYTMGLVRHDFAQIVEIGSQDVHPILYYLMLKIVMLILGDSILVARLFSMIPAILTGILGYTHIRKDFGSKVGLLFSVLIFALPVMPSYGAEIRMYTWTLFFATISAIYAYRISKENKVKNWSLFAIFSLATAHCHYYGLATVAIINALLLFHILITKNEEIRNAKRSYLV
ncbi:MAG: glycosyltransferase family 39 protein [Clostridia bacterium]|nr:glycosyltransferase family 39 protein [Clostridia bacterium]